MDTIEIKGNEINEWVLQELRRELIPPIDKRLVAAVVAGYGVLSVAAIALGKPAWLAVFTLILVFFFVGQPNWRAGRVQNAMVKNMRKTYGVPSCRFDVTLEAACIKSINVKTRETVRLPYEAFSKVVETKSGPALFTPQGHLVVFSNKAMAEAGDQVRQIIRERCVNAIFR